MCALHLPALFLLLLGAFAFSVQAQPQRRPQAAEAFRVQHFTTADGLPANNVNAIEQDALGFLWLGTGNGLVRYDGYTFESFLPKPNDATHFGGGSISAVHEDATGHLWFGGNVWDPGGLRRFDPRSERFTRFRHNPDDPNSLIHDGVTTITSSPDEPGVLWIGAVDPATNGGGLSRLDEATGTFTNYTTEDGLASDVERVLIGRDGTLWVSTGPSRNLVGNESPLNRFDPVTDTFTPFWLDSEPGPLSVVFSVVYEDRFGVLWIGTRGGTRGGGLHRFDRATETFTSFLPHPEDPSDPRNQVNVLLEDHTGTFWVGTNAGLFTFDRESKRFTLFPHQPPGSTIAIYEDRFGVLWIGSGGGLMKLERSINPFTVYRHDPNDPNSLAEDGLGPIYEDREGIIWIRSGRATLNQVDRRRGTVTRYRHVLDDPNGLPVAENVITSIFEDRAGTLWLGTCGPGSGLLRMDRGRDDPASRFSFTRFGEWDPDNWRISLCINYMLEDRAGRFWIAAWGQGLNMLEREAGTLTAYRNNPDDPAPSFSVHKPDQLYHLHEARSEPGILWVSTEAGPSRFDTETKTFTNYHTETLRRTMMTHEDRVGRFWVVTAQGGLHLFDRSNGAIQETFTTEDGLAHNAVWSILEDDRGFLWLSTSNGLSRFNPETRTFQNYYARDGLPDNVFGEGGRFKSASGELFFRGPTFSVSFFPDDFTDNPFPPEVVLTGLEIAGKPVVIGPEAPLKASMMVTEALTLSHTQNDLVFAYVGLHFSNPAQNRYRYVLEGYDGDWVEAGSQRAARYPRLPPGAYVFRVQAASSNGVWNEEGASVSITITPPWWRTWWAYAFYGLLFLAGVVALNRLQQRRLIRRERGRAMKRQVEQAHQIEAMNQQLRQHEQQLENQNRKLLELDQLKSRFFANISHEFRTPLTLILGPLKDLLDEAFGSLREAQRSQLTLMQRNGRRLLRLINQLLDLSRLEAGHLTLRARQANPVPLIKATAQAFASKAHRKQITLQVEVPQQEILLYFEPDKLEKVLYNLLSNAFKFTPDGGTIAVRVEEEKSEAGDYVEIIVKDTGEGIPADALPFIFDRFHQVDASSTREQKGTGIGLALTKELVALYGGTIDVESTVGVGSTFYVRLPQGRAHLSDEDIVDAEVSDEIFETPGARDILDAVDDVLVSEERLYTGDGQGVGIPPEDAPVILIVEDNDDVRGYLRSHLAADYRLVEAVDGVDGLEQARTLEPALVLSDVMMPRMDGYALCRAIKTDEKLNHIPVVLLTAKADEESKIKGLETGADDYLYKPFNAEELLVRVENLIEIRRRLRAHFSGEIVVQPAEITVTSADAAFLEQVRQIVEAQMHDSHFSVERLADEVNMSPRQLRRRLRALTKLSPSGYIRSMRLQRAAQLLEQQAGRISEVAYAVGFHNAEHFSRLFQQVFGVAPSQYKADQN